MSLLLRPWTRLALAGAALGALSCASAPAPSSEPVIGEAACRRAESGRAERLQAELDRLRDDLRRAEEALVAVESGLRGRHGRANAVSSLAQARIEVARASQEAPWRSSAIVEARGKLEDADKQIREGNFGAALFFVYRSSRIAALALEESRQARETPGVRFVRGSRVNLRAGPSTGEEILTVLTLGTPVFPEAEELEWILVRTVAGPVGWVHSSLLR